MRTGQIVYCINVDKVDFYEADGHAGRSDLFTLNEPYVILKTKSVACPEYNRPLTKLIQVTNNHHSTWWAKASAFASRPKRRRMYAIKTSAGFIEVIKLAESCERDESRFVKEKDKATLFKTKQDASYWFDCNFPNQEADFTGMMYG